FLVDGVKIEEVLRNVIDNGIRYSDENGKIRVRECVVKGGMRIWVEDDGSGIGEEDVGFVFEGF
ncbi:sensor histidine kinase, partial [Siminovitchia fortis]|uniref:sensor histidine kinase n=1 Tax=Siminovitchia fortis TaxID=254758 RepID=UPI0011A0D96E